MTADHLSEAMTRAGSGHVTLTTDEYARLLESLARLEEQHVSMNEKLKLAEERQLRMESRLEHHYVNEHKSFDTIVRAVEGGKIAGKFIGFLLATVAAVAGAWEWIHHNLTITPK